MLKHAFRDELKNSYLGIARRLKFAGITGMVAESL
jgi:hypothetical protein